MTGPGSGTATGRRERGGRRRFAAPAMREALAPVAGQMLRASRAQAAQITGQARREAQDAVAAARREADERLASAREAGRAQAAPVAAGIVNRGRRDARSTVLRARREAHDELRRQVRAAVTAIRGQPAYRPLLDRLRALAAATAGPGASVTEDPAGGAVAHGAGVVVDCSLPRLADAAVDALGAEVESLWTPGRPVRRREEEP